MVIAYSLWSGAVWFWQNIISNQGVSNVLSVLAISFATYVFIVEQRRSNAELERQQADQAKQRAQFVVTAQEIIAESVRMIDSLPLNLTTANPNYLADYRRLSHLIAPLAHVMDTLQHASPADGHLIMTLSRAHRSLQDMVDPSSSIGAVAHQPQYNGFVSDRRADLERRSEQLGRLMAVGSTLRSDEIASALTAVTTNP